jgi:hypothetical protein
MRASVGITSLMVKLVPMCVVVDLVPPLTVVVRICPMSKAWTATLVFAAYVTSPPPTTHVQVPDGVNVTRLLFVASGIVACCSKTKEKPVPMDYFSDPKTKVTYQATYVPAGAQVYKEVPQEIRYYEEVQSGTSHAYQGQH